MAELVLALLGTAVLIVAVGLLLIVILWMAEGGR